MVLPLIKIKFNLEKPEKAGGVCVTVPACFSLKLMDSSVSAQKRENFDVPRNSSLRILPLLEGFL